MRTRVGLFAAVGMLLLQGMAFGQAAPTAASFDVASVRPSPPLDMAKLQADMQAGKMPRMGPHVDGLRAEYIYLSLKDLICVAYKVRPNQISGPDWLGQQRFDVVARMPEGSTKDDAPGMLQKLLVDRFKLTAHRQTQEHPVYALIVAKGGPKLKESTQRPTAIDPDAPLKPGQMKIDGIDGPMLITRNSNSSSTIDMGAKGVMTQRMDGQMLHLDSNMTTMAGFAEMLTNFMTMGAAGSTPVIDQTGLKGTYQITIEVALADLMAAARSAGMNIPGPGAGSSQSTEASDPGGGTTVFKSVEAMGLKLEPRKAPIEQLVVDHVDKSPTEN